MGGALDVGSGLVGYNVIWNHSIISHDIVKKWA
jgi:hypothetical protein